MQPDNRNLYLPLRKGEGKIKVVRPKVEYEWAHMTPTASGSEYIDYEEIKSNELEPYLLERIGVFIISAPVILTALSIAVLVLSIFHLLKWLLAQDYHNKPKREIDNREFKPVMPKQYPTKSNSVNNIYQHANTIINNF